MKKQIRTQKHMAEQAAEASVRHQQPGEQVFESVEEMLRFDAEQTHVPPSVGEKLAASVQHEAPAKRASWWGRLFGQ